MAARSLLTLGALVVVAGGCATDVTSSTTAGATPTVTAPASATAASDTGSPASSTATTAALSSAGVACSPDPMAHVYNPERLHVLDACVTVTGTVALVRAEADGDYHVRLMLDPGQLCAAQDCLDAGDRSQQGGGLVVELVCAHAITQTDAVSACIGYHTLLPVPAAGDRLTVTGPWVLDADHGWNEIHPAESFAGAPSSPPVPTAVSSAPPPAAGPLAVSITASRYGYVAAATAPGATCSATARLPSGRTSTASGLQTRPSAGADGSVSWTYGTSSTTKPGTGTHTVMCALGGQTASASAPFTVG